MKEKIARLERFVDRATEASWTCPCGSKDGFSSYEIPGNRDRFVAEWCCEKCDIITKFAMYEGMV